MLAKAAGLDADELVVDLEDGVAAADKAAARVKLASARALGTLAVRINGLRTEWWEDDLAAARQADVIVVPKVESADEVQRVAARLADGVGLEVQIETARGLVEVERIAASGPPLEALVFGPGDFAASLGVPVLTIGADRIRHGARPPTFDDEHGLNERLGPGPMTASYYALARVAVAARAYGLQPIDGPYAVLDDEAGLRRSSATALALGYDGKWVIHPSQIAPVNEAFSPGDAELERARAILAAADGATRVSGEMVDAATKRLAEAVLARASAA
jgi:citrate lyase subunit beta/citryl-CoA lyase